MVQWSRQVDMMAKGGCQTMCGARTRQMSTHLHATCASTTLADRHDTGRQLISRQGTRLQQREDAFHAFYGFATVGQDRAKQLGVRHGRPRCVVGVPVEVTFWRLANETLVRHRCPLFDPNLGLEPCVCSTVDFLHALNLGVMNSFCRDGLWLLILEGA